MKTFFTSLLSMMFFMNAYAQTFYKGADLSYVNEMENCGATYYESGVAKDPFQILADHGANIVRVRLWHNPQSWSAHPTSYSSYNDVATTIARAKSKGMKVLLDFHYSDTWTDPGKQIIPSAWESQVNNTSALVNEMYNYTYQVLTDLNSAGLMPDLVQVGNETNGNMLSLEGADIYPVDWIRQRAIINAGINAVRDAGNATGTQPKVVLHVADPNNAGWWFGEVTSSSQPVVDFDIIGLSFYPEWHSGSVSQTGNIIENLKNSFGKDVMLVEVGVPWTKNWNDDATNMLSTLPAGYGKPSPAGQKNWLIDIATEVSDRGGIGVIYWEPMWVSTGCNTEWGSGSHWENATFFDFSNEVINDGGIQFLEQTYGSGNVPPVVSIVSPTDGATYPEGTDILISTNATDSDGSVTQVEFYANGGLLGVDTSAPFELPWTVLLGNTSLNVVAIDNQGASSPSSSISVTGTPVGNPSSIHVESILVGTQNVGGGKKQGTATVTIYDDFGNPTSGVNVQGTFSGTFNEAVTGTTSSEGEVVFTTSSSAKGGVSVNFCVDNATHSSLTYDSNQNVITCTGSGARMSTQNDFVALSNEVSIFPNPVIDGQFTIVSERKAGTASFGLINMSGQLVLNGVLAFGTTRVELPNDLKSGVYQLMIKGEGIKINSRLIIAE